MVYYTYFYNYVSGNSMCSYQNYCKLSRFLKVIFEDNFETNFALIIGGGTIFVTFFETNFETNFALIIGGDKNRTTPNYQGKARFWNQFETKFALIIGGGTIFVTHFLAKLQTNSFKKTYLGNTPWKLKNDIYLPVDKEKH